MSKYVSLKYLEEYEIEQVESKLREAFFDIGILSAFKPKMKVLIKPDLSVSASPDKAETTHPAVVRAIINILSGVGVKCIVGDSPYGSYKQDTLDEVYFNTGMLEVANLTNCELLTDLHTTDIEIPSGIKTKKTTLLQVVDQVDAIVNVGKSKIDDRYGYIGTTMNLFGLVPGEMKSLVINRMNTVGDLYNYVLDLHTAIKNKLVLNVLDGVVAEEAGKTERLMSCLAVADDTFALDASIIDILCIDNSTSIVSVAESRGICDKDQKYKIIGERVDKFLVKDFLKNDINATTSLHSNKHFQSRYYKSHQQRVTISPKKCKGCSICSEICPTGAIMMKFDKMGELEAHIDYKKCIHCFKCHTACPYKVIDVITPLGYKSIKREIDKQNT